MASVVVYRDKRDIRPLPEIPTVLVEDLRALIETKIKSSGLSYFQRLQAVYAFMDRYGAFVATFAVCQQGCSHCCRVDVEISRLEAEYIAINARLPLEQGSTRTAGHRGACRFLGGDGGCTIYEYRPFNCRTFHALDDPKYCAAGDEEHQVYGAAGFGYGAGVYVALAQWVDAVRVRHGHSQRDIRDWFPLPR